MPFLLRSLIVKQNPMGLCSKGFSQTFNIIVKKFFHNGKIMECRIIDAAFHFPADLTCRAIGIFIIDKQKSQVRMPEISLQSVLFRELQNLIDTFEEQAFQILLIVVSASFMFYQKCHVLENVSIFHVSVNHQFVCVHLLFLLLVNNFQVFSCFLSLPAVHGSHFSRLRQRDFPQNRQKIGIPMVCPQSGATQFLSYSDRCR